MKTTLTYPSYKPSGIEWLGEIPEHWEVRRLKCIADVRPSGVDKRQTELETSVRFLGTNTVYSIDEIRDGIELEYATASQSEMTGFLLREGDIILTKDSVVPTRIADISVIMEPLNNVICGYHLTLIRLQCPTCLGRFCFYYLGCSTVNRYFLSEAKGTTIIGIGGHVVSDVYVLLPPTREQRTIASYLDREMARIDTLIEKKKRQIELLQKKRAALISHAVTKGLDPNVRMKDSGIEWLGEIPEHWQVQRLKYSVDLVNQKFDGIESDLPYTCLEHIESWTGKRIAPNGDTFSEGQANLYRAGDVLFGKLRPYLAKVYAADADGICTGELLVFRPRSVHQRFFLNYLLNPNLISIVDSSTYGAKMPRANWNFIGHLPVLIPPTNEQQTIAGYIDRETARIETLIEKIQKSIDLLCEYRVALISATVTGKIDIRRNNKYQIQKT